MIKSKFALIIDSLFISALISILSFMWLRKIIKNAILVRIFQILTLVFCFILILYFLIKSNKRKLFSNSNKKFVDFCYYYLIASNDTFYIEFIHKLFNAKHIEDYLFKIDDKIFYINIKFKLTDKTFFFIQELLFKNKLNETQIQIIHREKDVSFDNLLSYSQLKINTISSDIILETMNKNNIYPIEKSEQKTLKLHQKIKAKFKKQFNTISKHHFKEIFFSALSLLFISFISPFSNYYLIIGSILLIISIIVLFKRDYNSNKSELDLLNKKQEVNSKQ